MGVYNTLQGSSHMILGVYNVRFTTSHPGLCRNLYPPLRAWTALQRFSFSSSFINVFHCPKSNIELWSWEPGRKEGRLSDRVCRVWLQQSVSLLLLNCFDASAAHTCGGHFPAKLELLLKAAFPATQSSQPKQKSKEEQTQCGLWQRSPSLHI